ncbi:hypothetical protein Esti_001682 [Eimeria stiedai]
MSINRCVPTAPPSTKSSCFFLPSVSTRPSVGPLSAAAQELFVDYVKGVNKHVDCIAIAPHAHLIATTTADAKVHVVLDASSTYFFNFREDTFSALDFWCKEQQQDGRAFVCGAMDKLASASFWQIVLGLHATLEFVLSVEDDEIRALNYVCFYFWDFVACMQLHRSPKPLQKGVVTQLVASKGPWVITRSEGADTELRVHSYSGDLLASVDTKQVENFQLSVSSDGCFFGCAAWAPGVKIFEVKAKGGAFQKVEKAMDIRSSQGLSAFSLSADKSRAATLDKAGKLAVWRIDVRHAVGFLPLLLLLLDRGSASAAVAVDFTVDGSLLIVVSGPDLFLFHAATLELFKAVARATPQPIQHLLVAANNKFLLLCAVPSNAT